MLLTDRQLCMLANSANELKNVLEKVIKEELTKFELLNALKILEDATSCVKAEVEYNFEVNTLSTEVPS